MTGLEIAMFAVVLLIGAGILLQRRPLNHDTKDLSKDFGRIEKDLENERAEKNKLAGENRQIRDEIAGIKSEAALMKKEKEKINDELTDLRIKYRSEKTKLDAERKSQEKDFMEKIEKLDESKRSFEDEKERVIREDQERLLREEEERDRQWKEHEIEVVASLTELCKQGHHHFTTFTSKNLPSEFDGSLEPDFMIELFPGEYVIFDAKANRARDRIQGYIDEQIKKTTTKIKGKSYIYPHVFLVIPMEAIHGLKKHIYRNGDYHFYIVSREALSPILASLKRISTYQFAEKLDPQKRENILNLLSEMFLHISYRNAHELVLTKYGIEVLERLSQVDPELSAEVEEIVSKKKVTLLQSELKRIANNLTEQNIEIQKMIAPKAAIKKPMIDAVQTVISQKLL